MKPADIIAAFRDKQVRGPAGIIEVDEVILTWKSMLFFGKDFVMKVRRPIDIDGENQAGLGARITIAERERYSGGRLSPRTYLAPLVLVAEDDGSLTLREGREDGEPVVAMYRLPFAERLDRVLLEPGFKPERLEPLMMQLFDYHVKAPVERLNRDVGRKGRASARWTAACGDLRAALEAAPPDVDKVAIARDLDALEAFGSEHFEAATQLFAHRVAEGRMRHVHGALQLTHIFLPADGGRARIIDPADGSDEERYIDTSEEIGGLVIELRLLKPRAFVDKALAPYIERSQDKTLVKVLDLQAMLVAVKRSGRALREAAAEGVGSPAALRAVVYMDLARLFADEFIRHRPDPT